MLIPQDVLWEMGGIGAKSEGEKPVAMERL